MKALEIPNFLKDFNLPEKLSNLVTENKEGVDYKHFFQDQINKNGVSVRLISNMLEAASNKTFDRNVVKLSGELKDLVKQNEDQYCISFATESMYHKATQDPFVKEAVTLLQECYNLPKVELEQYVKEGKLRPAQNHPSVKFVINKYTTELEQAITRNLQKANEGLGEFPVKTRISYVQESKDGQFKLFSVFGEVFKINNKTKEVSECVDDDYDRDFYVNSQNIENTSYKYTTEGLEKTLDNGKVVNVLYDGVYVNEDHKEFVDLEIFVDENKATIGKDYTRVISEAQYLAKVYDNIYVLDNVQTYENEIRKTSIIVSEGSSGGHYVFDIVSGSRHLERFEKLQEAIDKFKELSGVDLSEKYNQTIFAESVKEEKIRILKKKEFEQYNEAKEHLENIAELYKLEESDEAKLNLLESYNVLKDTIDKYEAKQEKK